MNLNIHFVCKCVFYFFHAEESTRVIVEHAFWGMRGVSCQIISWISPEWSGSSLQKASSRSREFICSPIQVVLQQIPWPCSIPLQKEKDQKKIQVKSNQNMIFFFHLFSSFSAIFYNPIRIVPRRIADQIACPHPFDSEYYSLSR